MVDSGLPSQLNVQVLEFLTQISVTSLSNKLCLEELDLSSDWRLQTEGRGGGDRTMNKTMQ